MTRVTQAHIDARTEDILGAAERMFVRKGVDAATMSEIASEAGLSAGAIYRYFPSKEELLRSVCGGAVDEARAMFDQATAETSTPLEAISEIGRAAWRKIKVEGFREETILNLESILISARQSGALRDSRREMLRDLLRRLASLIEGAQRAGEVDLKADPQAMAGVLLACHLGSGLLALQLEDEIDTDTYFESLMALVAQFAPDGAQ